MWTISFHAHAFNIGDCLTGIGRDNLPSTRIHTAYEPKEDLDALKLILHVWKFHSFPCDLPITESSDCTLSVIYNDVSRP